MGDLDLARRAVACKGWRWMPGALAILPDAPPLRITHVYDGGDALREHGWLPGFNDAATRGVLLALVKERRNAPHGYVTCGRSRCASRDYAPGVWDWYWAFWDDQETFVASGDSEVSALIAALEAAPERKL